jgi:hypothetical protein
MSKRISKVAQCIRKTSATVRVPRHLMPDSDKFDANQISPDMSSKFTEVIQTIQKLDKEDQEKHGMLYKHFIFTDIRESSYGAKALASFLIASGYDFRMESIRGKTVYTHKPGEPGGCNGFTMLQSLPLWKKPLSVQTKREILNVFNRRPENINGELLRIIILDSKYKEGIDLFDVKYVHLLEPAIAVSDLKQAVGRATRFCGQKGLPFAPRRGWKLNVYIYSTILPHREPFVLPDTDAIDTVPFTDSHALMLAHSGLDLALLTLTKELTILGITTSVDYDLNYKINNFSIESAVLDAVDEMVIVEIGADETKGGKKAIQIYKPEDIDDQILYKCAHGRKSKLFPFTKPTMHQVAREMGYKMPKSSKRGVYCELLRSNSQYLDKLFGHRHDILEERQMSPNIHTITPVHHFSPGTTQSASNQSASNAMTKNEPFKRENTPNPLTQLTDLPFDDFQKAVMDLYGKYKWASPVIKSGCDNSQFGQPGSAVTFTHTQDFIRHYLTPDSPFKGLLAWHSVGTGKTCMAVAAATTQFEQAGYTILWVTRNALMADVYKNIFGSVCSIPIMEKLQTGEPLPQTLSQQKRMLSRSWMAPISYRMFQNALEEKNELGRILHRNNPGDPLRNTFLIMDEIHKLQDGDLSASESADFHAIQDYIFKSYSTSGAESVRPLLMTATPITDKPHELFEILNMLIPTEDRRFMPFDEFRETYSSPAGEISEDGKTYFKDRAKGLISYLNREFDPTTFSQPVFHTVSVQIGTSDETPTVESVANTCLQQLDTTGLEKPMDCSTLELEQELALENAKDRRLPPKEYKKVVKEIKQTMKQRIKDCKAHNKTVTRTRKLILKDANKCYKSQLDDYVQAYRKSQATAVGTCIIGKQTKKEIKNSFVSREEVGNAIHKGLS